MQYTNDVVANDNTPVKTGVLRVLSMEWGITRMVTGRCPNLR